MKISRIRSVAARGTFLVVATALLAAGCVGVGPRARALPPRLEPLHGWTSAFDRDHPLVGRVEDLRSGRPATWSDLTDAASAADVVLLGEQHDNADHHRLQAALLAALMDAGARPVLALEQVDANRQPDLDAALRDAQGRPPAERASRVATAVGWKDSGWPDFAIYRPLFETALAAGLPLRGANLSRAELRAAPQGAPPVTLEPAARRALVLDIEESHCGHADARMVEHMVAAQLRRDEALAAAVRAAAPGGGEKAGRPRAVLVAGNGHVRRDYGVPLHLAPGNARAGGSSRVAGGGELLSVAFVEVRAGLDGVVDYSEAMHAAGLPFDYAVFTPRADDEDPCEKFRASLERMRQRQPGH